MNANFPALPSIRSLAYPARPEHDPLNHQHDIVYSLNFGPRILARTIDEEQWRREIDYRFPEGSHISIRCDDRGSHIFRYILIRTEHSFRRVTYVYRPDEADPVYHFETDIDDAEHIRAIPDDAQPVTPPVDIAITVDANDNVWHHTITLM